jgi:hypothetical protein
VRVLNIAEERATVSSKIYVNGIFLTFDYLITDEEDSVNNEERSPTPLFLI